MYENTREEIKVIMHRYHQGLRRLTCVAAKALPWEIYFYLFTVLVIKVAKVKS